MRTAERTNGSPFQVSRRFCLLHVRSLSGGSDLSVPVVGRRAPRTAARLRRRLLLPFLVALLAYSDGRGKHVESDSFFVLRLMRRFRPSRSVAARMVAAVAAVLPIFALRTALLLALVYPFTGVVVLRVIAVVGGSGVLAVILVVAEILTLTALLFEASAALAKHAVIMIRKLEIIFGLNSVPCELRVACHVLVFLVQLRRIAALPIVLPIAGLPHVLGSLSPATAPAATLTIVDQMPTSLRAVEASPAFPRLDQPALRAALTFAFRLALGAKRTADLRRR